MTPESWSGVLTSLELGTGDMIADLGSGRGALVIQAALEVGPLGHSVNPTLS